MPNYLKPLLVIGTGFHRNATDENPAFDCLYSWPKLLREVANHTGLLLRWYFADRVRVDIYDEHEKSFFH